ncbi:hypothetical protein BD626DRAFT_490743 [Schizophyllum amplum]|uniref:BTB domain-containing protein n=1 Tax=Schizophyllum amplum TaxID=97359 RepID=A0A550CJX2_9AGAR|nr:hypothetical protein BD626DRAFT_490743 [Auriculariopsis ampla]
MPRIVMQSTSRTRRLSDPWLFSTNTYAMPSEDTQTITRRESIYVEGGDIIVQAGTTLFCLHAFHLRRSTSFFSEQLSKAIFEVPGAAKNDHAPLVLDDVQAEDFKAMMWFFYDSKYEWSDTPNKTSATVASWESILLLAKKWNMRQVARVACHALGRVVVLDDIRKISLCLNHKLGNSWMSSSLDAVVARVEPLSADEIRLIGIDAAAKLSGTREASLRLKKKSCAAHTCPGQCGSPAYCYGSTHVCRRARDHHSIPCPVTVIPLSSIRTLVARLDFFEGREPKDAASEAQSLRQADYGGDVYFEIQGRIFRLHSYHLKRTSNVFAVMFSLPPTDGVPKEGFTEHHPVKLDIRASDFENLLHFFYDSAYEWLPTIDPSATPMWESILHLADMFDMDEVQKVALYALGLDGALSDARKIALCVRYSIDRSWASAAFTRLCTRRAALTAKEITELQPNTLAAICTAREAAIRAMHGAGSDAATPTTLSPEEQELMVGGIVRDNFLLYNATA